MRARVLRPLVLAALAALVLAGCGVLTDDGEGDLVINDGSVKEAVVQYDAVLADARAAIDAAVGEQAWDLREGAGGANCDGDLDLVYESTGISTSRELTSARADDIADAVAPVVEEAGFDGFDKVAGNDVSMEYRAVDERGATFFLTMNADQVSLQIQTGCYRWDPADAEWTPGGDG